MLAYYIDSAHGLVTTRVSGRLTFSDLVVHIHHLMRDPKFNSDFNSLIVAMDVEAVPPMAAVGTLAPLVRAWSKRRAGVKWAFVLPTEASRAAAESALSDVRLTTVETRCFVAESAALAWLERVSTPAGSAGR
jgi:hypothetical protein